MQELGDLAGDYLGTRFKVRAVPTAVLKPLFSIMGLFVPGIGDMGAMTAWFDTGKYVANTSRQSQVFGPVPTPEDAVARFAGSLGHNRS